MIPTPPSKGITPIPASSSINLPRGWLRLLTASPPIPIVRISNKPAHIIPKPHRNVLFRGNAGFPFCGATDSSPCCWPVTSICETGSRFIPHEQQNLRSDDVPVPQLGQYIESSSPHAKTIALT